MLGIEFAFQEMPMGGSALDSVGVPLPEETLLAAKQSDAVLLGAIGGYIIFRYSFGKYYDLVSLFISSCQRYKWDKNEKHLKPETGLLQIREGLKVFANLRPATVLPQVMFCLVAICRFSTLSTYLPNSGITCVEFCIGIICMEIKAYF